MTVNKKGLNETLSIREMTSYFARAIAKQNGHFGSELERAKGIQKGLYIRIKVLLCKNRLKNTLNVRQMTRF